MLEATDRKIPVIYHLDDNDMTLEIARDFFKRRGVVYAEVHSLYEAYKATGDRMPTLILINTAIKDPHDYVKRNCFPTISVLRQTRPGIKMVTIAKDYRQDDLIDTQREGCLELVEFSLDGLERVLELATKIIENGGPGGTEKEIQKQGETELYAGGGSSFAVSGTEGANELQAMIYNAVKSVFEEFVQDRKRSTPPPVVSQQMPVYQYH